MEKLLNILTMTIEPLKVSKVNDNGDKTSYFSKNLILRFVAYYTFRKVK